MPHNVYPIPFVISPPDDLVEKNFELMKMSQRVGEKFARGNATDDFLQIMGRMLWNSLNIQTAFAAEQQKAGLDVMPIIIRSSAADVQALPWETVYHPEHGFLGRQPAFTLTRQFVHAGIPQAQQEKGPLRVLLFTSLPGDVDPEKERLNVEEEQFRMQEALSPWIAKGLVQLEIPDDGRFSTFKELLKGFRPHLLFLSGHGFFYNAPHAQKAYGEFLFESETGESERIKENELANALTGTGVQAVVLSACESGKASPDALSNGLMRRISAQGIPHVIGMRESILDVAGIEFARELCDSLASQEPIDVALQIARMSVYKNSGFGQWCLPILFSSQPAMSLIDWNFRPILIYTGYRFKNPLGTINLPARFIGRRAEMRQLKNSLIRGEIHDLLITGPGGQGKTALAAKLALDLQMYGRQVFTWSGELYNSWDDFVLQMEQALDKCGVEQYERFSPHVRNEQERAVFLLDLLMKQFNRRLVLFLDRLDAAQDPDTKSLKNTRILGWLEAAYSIQDLILIVTSRFVIPNWAGRHLRLGKTSYGDFLQMAQFELPSSVLEKRDKLSWFYETLGGNGRGLEYFAATVRNRKDADEYVLLERLKQSKVDLQEYMAIGEIYMHLSPASQILLQRLPVYHEAVPREGQLNLAYDLPYPEVLFQELLGVSFLDESCEPHQDAMQYRCNPLVEDWLKERKLADASAVVLNIAAAYHLHLLSQKRKTLDQVKANYQVLRRSKRDTEADLSNLNTQKRQALRLAFEAYSALNRAERCYEADQLALDYIVGPLIMNGTYQRLLDEFLPRIFCSRELPMRARAMAYTGIVMKDIGDYRRAWWNHNQALEIMCQIGDKHGEGTELNQIGQIYQTQGEYGKALSYFERSLEIYKQIGDKKGEEAALNNVAMVYQAQGDYTRARTYLKEIEHKWEGSTLIALAQDYYVRGDYRTALGYLAQALESQQRVGNKSGEATTLNNISQIYQAQGDYHTAMEYLKKALVIERQVGNKAGEGTTLSNISDIYLRQTDYHNALKFLEQALLIQHENGEKAKEGLTLNNISAIYRRQADYDKALPCLEQALSMQQQIGDRAGVSTTLNNIATIFLARGEYMMALMKYNQALIIQLEIGNKRGANTTLNNIATIYQLKNEHNRALESFKQVLDICWEIGDKIGAATTLNNMALCLQKQGEYKTALGYLKESLMITQRLGDKVGEGVTLNNIGLAYLDLGEYQMALEYMTQSLVVRQQIGDQAGEGQAFNGLAQIHLSLHDPENAVRYLEQSLKIVQQIDDKAGLCAGWFTRGHVHLKNGETQEAIDAWIKVYELAKELNLSEPLHALKELAPKVGLSKGLDDWERLAQQKKKEDKKQQ